MVRTILLVGLERRWPVEMNVEVTEVPTGAEAVELVSRRSFDAVAIGRVPDRSTEEVVGLVTERRPGVPVVLASEALPDSIRRQIWEYVPPTAASRLADVLRQAGEVGWLRRENERLSRASADSGHRAVDHTFERGSIREMERLMIVERLERLNQNRTRSAASLDISVRTLRNKLREYRERSAPVGASTEER